MKFLFFLLFYLSGHLLYSQVQLKGLVLAAATKTPLENASVFLSNTSNGTVTDAAGGFTLTIAAGKYELVTSFVGYETDVQTISDTNTTLLVIYLKTKPAVLDNVVVGGFEKDGWRKWGNLFLESFIGTSEFATDCALKNHTAIRFRHNKKENTITAVASEQLIIENKALGYTLKYQLEAFEYNFKSGYMVYLGYPLFIAMEGGAAKQKRWSSNRAKVYTGSNTHFMRALFRNRINEEGFAVRRLVKEPNAEKIRIKELYSRRAKRAQAGAFNMLGIPDSASYYEDVLNQPDELSTYSAHTLVGDSIAYKVNDNTAGLEFEDYLHITYTKAAPPRRYAALSPHNKQMASQIKFVSGMVVEVQANGSFYPPLNLIVYGYWAWSEKMAHMLPLDYTLPANK